VQSWRKITPAFSCTELMGASPTLRFIRRVDARRLVPNRGLLGDRGRLGAEQASRTGAGSSIAIGGSGRRAVPALAGSGRQDEPVRQAQVLLSCKWKG